MLVKQLPLGSSGAGKSTINLLNRFYEKQWVYFY
jgi:hypothetical protein